MTCVSVRYFMARSLIGAIDFQRLFKKDEVHRSGHVEAWRNGTTHVIFEPLDFMFRTNGMPRAQDAQERLSPGWFLLFPNHALTLLVFTVCSHRTVNTGHW